MTTHWRAGRLVRGRRNPHWSGVPWVRLLMELMELAIVVGGCRTTRGVEWTHSLVGHLSSSLLVVVGYLRRHLLLVVGLGRLRYSKRGPHSGPRDVMQVPVWGSGYHWGHCQLTPLARINLGGEKHAFKWKEWKEKGGQWTKWVLRRNKMGWNEMGQKSEANVCKYKV